MRVLLDSHALIWALGDDPALGRQARDVLADQEVEKLVSGASAMEIMIKYRKGRLPQAEALARDFKGVLGQLDCVPLAISFDHSLLAGALDIPHKDPFDRLLIAQARVERVPIVSNETLFDAFGVERIW
ncbi:MAG: type II toxin-antitoxin system VapC family toxin [Sphingomicrobium sp.]